MKKARTLVVSELSAGQMVEDVRMAVEGQRPVEFLGFTRRRGAVGEGTGGAGRKLLQKLRRKTASQGTR